MINSMKDKPATEQIDDIIKIHSDWKGELLSKLRTVILSADSNVCEEVKWKMKTRLEGLPVWSFKGIICFAEIWKDNIKLIFYYGSELEDPKKLFNARLKSSTVRAIEFHENDKVNEPEIKALVLEAVQLNNSKKTS